MREFVLSCIVGLGLIALGASHAKAAPFCLKFAAFCDCLTIDTRVDILMGQKITRYVVTWENQDCAGTTSKLQGGIAGGIAAPVNFVAGELNPAFGLAGYNWNFSWSDNPEVFDLDLLDPTGAEIKVQDDSPYLKIAGPCPPSCTVFGELGGSENRPSYQR